MALIALDPASDGLGGVLTDPSRATTARAFLDGHGADSPIMASMARPHAMACVRVWPRATTAPLTSATRHIQPPATGCTSASRYGRLRVRWRPLPNGYHGVRSGLMRPPHTRQHTTTSHHRHHDDGPAGKTTRKQCQPPAHQSPDPYLSSCPPCSSTCTSSQPTRQIPRILATPCPRSLTRFENSSAETL